MYNITHNHPAHFDLHGTTVAAANMVFWVAVTLLALRTSCSGSVGNVPKCEKIETRRGEMMVACLRTRNTEPK